MNTPAKYVVSKTLENPIWRNTTVIRDDIVETIRKLKAQPGKTIVTDGSTQLLKLLLENDLVDELYFHVYPLLLGRGKRLAYDQVHSTFTLLGSQSYPTGVVGLHYARRR
jgi:dihydrofolate reductase